MDQAVVGDPSIAQVDFSKVGEDGCQFEQVTILDVAAPQAEAADLEAPSDGCEPLHRRGVPPDFEVDVKAENEAFDHLKTSRLG